MYITRINGCKNTRIKRQEDYYIMLHITNLPEYLKIDFLTELKQYTINGYKYAKYPVIMKIAYSETINKYLLNSNTEKISIPYNSNHIKWKDFIIYMTENEEVNELLYKYIRDLYNRNLVKRYHIKSESYNLNIFSNNYLNTYNILNNIPYKGYTNDTENTWIKASTFLYMTLKQGLTQKAFYTYKKIFNAHSNYMICKMLEYIYKVNNISDSIKVLDNKKYYFYNKIISYKKKKEKTKMKTIKNSLASFKNISSFRGRILLFSFKGLLLKLFPPIYDNNRKDYNYSCSLYVKIGTEWKDIYDLPIGTEERKIFFDDSLHTEEERAFRYDLLLLMNTKRTKLGYTGSLINHLIYIDENISDYLKYYVVEYCKTTDSKVHHFMTTEFSKTRAEYKGRVTKNYFKGEVLSVKEYKLSGNNAKKVLYDK